MYKKCTTNFYIYTKNAQTVQNLYKVQTKNDLKLEMYVFFTYKHCKNYTYTVHTHSVQTIQNVYKC